MDGQEWEVESYTNVHPLEIRFKAKISNFTAYHFNINHNQITIS